MLYGWTMKQLDCAIDRMSREIADAIARHERPEKIYSLRRQMARLEAIRDGGKNHESGRDD
jgi:hypothetical protein